MPNTPSIKNERVYRALRRKGMPKSQAAAISNAQVKKDSAATGMAIAPTGGHALFNNFGLEGRRKHRKQKACTCTEKATGAPGELLSPGVRRIRGNLCNVHGKYGPCDKALSGKKPKAGKKPPKPKQTPEQRAQARTAERDTNAQSVAQRMADTDTGLSPSGSRALTAFAKGQQPTEQEAAGLASMGLAERASDGSYRMTPTGRAVVSAMRAGDYQRAVDGISRASDQAGKRTERQTAAQERSTAARKRQQDAAGKRASARIGRELTKREPRKAGSGGGKKPAAEKPRAPIRARRARASSGASSSGGSSAAPPKKPAPKPEKAPAKQIAQPLRDAATALSEGADVSDEQVMGLVRNGLAKLNKDGVPILTAAGLRATMKAANLFTVFKDSAGHDRWLAITTTAYEDKDQEIISTKAIGGAVAIGDSTGQRGPLRYWHVPGMDIGDCDYQAQGGPGGRFLIESGTFRSKAFAQLGQRLAESGYQMSPGFVHGKDQPRDGVYDAIAIYERSAVPAHRAANYFTRFTAKENAVLTEEKAAEYRQKAGDNPEALALLESMLGRVETTDKAAQGTRLTFKETGAAPPDEIEVGGVVYTIKAMAPASMEQAAETEMADAETEQMDDGEMEEEAGGMDDAAFAQMIAQAVVQAITPLLDIEKKMAGHMADLKGTLGGYATAKDDAQAQQAAQIAELSAKLKELTGDLPDSVLNGARGMYRPSEAPSTLLTTESAAKIKEQVQQIPAGLTDPAEINAYHLIFGNQ